jgi:hypothetical protein
LARADSGDTVGAVPGLVSALEDAEQSVGPHTVSAVTIRIHLADCHAELGNTDDAIAGLRRAAADCRTVLGPNAPLAMALQNEAFALQPTGAVRDPGVGPAPQASGRPAHCAGAPKQLLSATFATPPCVPRIGRSLPRIRRRSGLGRGHSRRRPDRPGSSGCGGDNARRDPGPRPMAANRPETTVGDAPLSRVDHLGGAGPTAGPPLPARILPSCCA